MFLGEDTHSLDGKGRVVLPSRFRAELDRGCVVTKGQDGQLVVFPTASWEEKAAEVMERPQNRAGRRFARTFFGGADQQDLDKSGRLLLKPDLREYASLEMGTEVVVVGVFDHIELWNPGSYDGERSRGDEVYMSDEEDEIDA